MGTCILYESDLYSLFHEYESPLLVNKTTGERRSLREHYGDPSCGMVDDGNNICVVGGQGVNIVNLFDGSSMDRLMDDSVHSLKQDGPFIKILIDPWSDNPGTWLLDIKTLELRKVSDGPDFRGEEYREDVGF